MRKISPEAFDLSLSRGQSLNPFMATLSSGAISSQQQSVLPPLPQQQSAPPPHPQQWSMPPPPLQQQSAFLPHQWSTLPPQQQSVPLPLFLEAEPDHVDALGSDDEGVLASTQTCSNKRLGPDGPQEQPLSTPRVDVEFADLGEVHDHCNIDEEEVTLEGGRFSKEEHAGIDEIYQNILALAEGFGKKHHQSVQCVLTKLSMGFASREQRAVTSSWNAYVGLNLNPDSNVSQNDYIRLIVGLAYKKMIADAGGRDSDGWRRQHDDLVKQYDALRKERGEDIHLSLWDQKNAMRGIAHQWMADMNTAKACGIHLGVVMVASEEGAKKENWFLVNSPFMQDYMMKCLGLEKILLSQIHQALCISEKRSKDVIPCNETKYGQGVPNF